MRWLGIVALVVLGSGCAVLRHDEEQQLGRRVWELRASDWWPRALPGLERALIDRAAERTRDMGLRYFVVRDFSGDLSSYRSFMVDATESASPTRPSRIIDLLTGLDRVEFFLKTPYSDLRLSWAHLKFRMLSDAEVQEHFDVLDARKIRNMHSPQVAPARAPRAAVRHAGRSAVSGSASASIRRGNRSSRLT